MPDTRIEDPPLLRGQARFVDDIHLPGTLHAAFVRSPLAHAAISGIDKAAAMAAPDVHAVWTLDDLRPDLAEHRLVVGLPSPAYRQSRDRPVLAAGEVVHVGEPAALVVAESRYAAEDAAAMVDVAYDPLPVVADCRDALATGTPPVHRGGDHNLLAELTMEFGDVEGAFASAPRIFAESLSVHRGGGHSIEGRGALARHDPADDMLTLWSSTQTPHAGRSLIARMLGRETRRVRVVTPAVGGGFGPKLVTYPEEVAVALAALLLGRPVKWIEDRREHFTASTQERDQHWDVEAAFDADGTILGVRGTMVHDHGAYTARGANLPYESALTVTLPYDVPAYRLTARAALTNKVPVTPVRGAGHPQAVFAMERLLDKAADGLGIDRVTIRERNLIGPERMPCTRPLESRGGRKVVLDSGDYPGCMRAALEEADWDGFASRRQAAAARGRTLGIGLANFVKGTGRGPFESACVSIDPSGAVSVASGAVAMGQGIETMLADIVAEGLGCDRELVRVTAGDTAAVALGIGGFNSRQAVTAGSSAFNAARKVRGKALAIAARHLEAAEEDLEIAGGEVRVRGAPDLAVGLGRLAEAVAGTPGVTFPANMTPGLAAEENTVLDDMPFANGTAVAEVEIDRETGHAVLVALVVAHDCGRIVNPAIVEGQIVGGAAHAVGNALYEWMGFDGDAQPLTTTLADYLLPGSTDVPRIDTVHMESPSPLNPIGVKGVGECGTVPTAAAIVAAVEDALGLPGGTIDRTPLTPADIGTLSHDHTL